MGKPLSFLDREVRGKASLFPDANIAEENAENIACNIKRYNVAGKEKASF